MALKRHFGMKSWTEWEDEDIRLRKPAAMAKYRELLREDIELFTYIQYLFFEQWTKLKAYINDLGIGIIGDIPIYVAWIPLTCGRSPNSSSWTRRTCR